MELVLSKLGRFPVQVTESTRIVLKGMRGGSGRSLSSESMPARKWGGLYLDCIQIYLVSFNKISSSFPEQVLLVDFRSVGQQQNEVTLLLGFVPVLCLTSLFFFCLYRSLSVLRLKE